MKQFPAFLSRLLHLHISVLVLRHGNVVRVALLYLLKTSFRGGSFGALKLHDCGVIQVIKYYFERNTHETCSIGAAKVGK